MPLSDGRESRSIELDKLIHNNDNRSLDMLFGKEGATWRAIGEPHGKFYNLIGQSLGMWYHLTTIVGIKCLLNLRRRLLTYSGYELL